MGSSIIKGVRMLGLNNAVLTVISSKTGEKRLNVKATVDIPNIFIFDNFLIERGDIIEHKMGNGATEKYTVVEPNFYEAIPGMPIMAHYQLKVRNVLSEEKDRTPTVINNYGDLQNQYVHSKDQSINISITDNKTVLHEIDKLKKVIELSELSSDEKDMYQEAIKCIKDNIQKDKPNTSLIKALLKSLPPINDVTTIVTNILSIIS